MNRPYTSQYLHKSGLWRQKQNKSDKGFHPPYSPVQFLGSVIVIILRLESFLCKYFRFCIVHQLWYSLKRIISHYNYTKHAIQSILPVAIHAMPHGIPHHIQVIAPFGQRDVHPRAF